MHSLRWIAVAVLLAAACGGASSESGYAGSVGDETTDPEVKTNPELEKKLCESLCERVTTCTVDLSPEKPSSDEVTEFRSTCLSDICDRPDLSKEKDCLENKGGECTALFECLRQLDAAEGQE